MIHFQILEYDKYRELIDPNLCVHLDTGLYKVARKTKFEWWLFLGIYAFLLLVRLGNMDYLAQRVNAMKKSLDTFFCH